MESNRNEAKQVASKLPGFERLLEACRRSGVSSQLAAPAQLTPEVGVRLECALDPLLAALLGRANGGDIWELHLYGIGNPDRELVSLNEGKRAARSDLKRLWEFLLFCKFEYRPEYLATIPSLATAEGLQPVAYLDLNEGLKVVPVASSVDRVFDLAARCIESLYQRYGSVEDGASEERFPWDFSELVAADDALLVLLASGRLDRFSSPSPEVVEWLGRVRGGRTRQEMN